MFNTIRARMLFGFGLLLICLLALLGAFLYVQVKNTVVPLTRDLSQEVLRGRSAALGYLFRGYLNDVRTLSRDAVMRSGNLHAIQQSLLRRHADNNPDYEMVFFADVAGDYVGSMGVTGNVSDRDYFKAIMQEGKNEVIGDPVISRATGATVFVVATAVTNAQGERIGMVAATVLLDTLTDIAGAINIGSQGFGWVMDRQGLLIAHPMDSLRMKLNLIDSSAQGYRGLDLIGRTLAKGESGFSTYQRPDGAVLATIYTPIPNTPNWGLGVSLQETTLMARAYGLMRAILWGMAAVMALVLLLVYVLSGKIAAPLRQLMGGVEYVGAGHLDYKLDIHTGDEIERLAGAFNRMTGDLQTQMRHLAQVTAEKARVDGELLAAKGIQASMLPRAFPPYPNFENLDLFATMEPAKEVGGDFYDFYVLDDHRICVCVGDVSGKGVPAALFMVIGMTILKNLVRQGLPLNQVFETANNMLCSDNGMFITVFMGILDTRTGEFEYISAGHNPPMISQAGKPFALIDTRVHLVLGGMEDIPYRASQLRIAPGDTLFVYTDGLTEAQNGAGEFFTEARMLAAINSLQNRGVRDLVEGMRQQVANFVLDAPPADDLTMLALTVKDLSVT